MDGEQPITPSAEQAAPAIVEDDATESPVDLQQPEGDVEAEDGNEADEDGLDDLDFGFKKYRVPKDLKVGIEQWRAATTKKEQEVASRSRELEARALQQSQADEAELRHRAVLVDVADKMKAYDNVDWLSLAREDPIAYNEHRAYLDQLTKLKTDAEKGVSEASNARSVAAQQDYAKRTQETREFAEKLPGWSPEVDQKLQAFVASKGITPRFIQENLNPLLYEMIHLAWHGEQSLKRATAAVTKPAPAQIAQNLAPLEKVAGKSSPGASKSLSDLARSGDMEAYVAARRSGRVR